MRPLAAEASTACLPLIVNKQVYSDYSIFPTGKGSLCNDLDCSSGFPLDRYQVVPAQLSIIILASYYFVRYLADLLTEVG
ncbi:hypothetical protein MCOR25_005558 [Pyricularia grisea]|nr:hypothetical protein MCOR25_005558 [Pyricularia grisea]